MEKLISEYLLGCKTNGKDFCYEYGALLKGCMQMHQVTGDEKYLEFIMKYLQDVTTKDGKLIGLGTEELNIDSVSTMSVLFYIYDLTGDEKYRKAAGLVQNKLQEFKRDTEGNFVWKDGMEKIFPFYMEYETRYNKKANYNDITTQLSGIRDKGQKASYLMALIDVIDAMSIEIFEHYKSLEKIFKEEVKELLPEFISQVEEQTRRAEEGDFVRSRVKQVYILTVAYAVIKACRIGVLSKEKYEKLGLDAFQSILQEKELLLKDTGAEDGCKTDGKAECIGIFMMAYAQKLMMQKQ